MQDIRRRGQVLAARRLVIGLLILIVLLLNFSDEIGSAATVVGFAAAGIAVALQNVILSVAGYFFLIGKFGIKAGDRVQLGGVTGDVIDIGLVKLSMMELGGDGTHRQPTGRVVVFSNSIVFQPAGNYSSRRRGPASYGTKSGSRLRPMRIIGWRKNACSTRLTKCSPAIATGSARNFGASNAI